MADAEDSKSSVGNHVRVQVPLSAPQSSFFSLLLNQILPSRWWGLRANVFLSSGSLPASSSLHDGAVSVTTSRRSKSKSNAP